MVCISIDMFVMVMFVGLHLENSLRGPAIKSKGGNNIITLIITRLF